MQMSTNCFNISPQIKEEKTTILNCDKKRKNKLTNTKKDCINCNFNNKNAENALNNEEKSNLIIYIKVLLDIYKNLPNIIGIIDKIIERKATSLVPSSSIYGDSYLQTYNQVNKVINLTERKDKLLNLYIIIEQILNSLNYEDRKIAVLKFIQKNTTQEIAKEINLTERTVYRKANSILEKIALFMLNQNWNTSFLKHQIGKESWIEDLFKQKLKESQLKNSSIKDHHR